MRSYRQRPRFVESSTEKRIFGSLLGSLLLVLRYTNNENLPMEIMDGTWLHYERISFAAVVKRATADRDAGMADKWCNRRTK